MQFTCNKNELSTALQIVLRAINTTATLESLQGVLIIVKENKTIIKATNLEVGVEMVIPTVDTQEGSVLINPKVLIDAIKYSNSKSVTLTNKETSLVIELDSGKTKIKVLNSADFPNRPKEKTGEKVQLKVKNLIQGIRSVLYAVSHSVIKPELASVYIWQEGQQLVFVATDSFRLAEKKVNQSIPTTDNLSILIPQKNTQDLVGILEQLNEDALVDVYIDKDQFSLSTEDEGVYITLRTIDGAFPDYRKILPKDPTTEVTLLKQDLSQIIKKAGVFSDKFNKVTLQVDIETKKIIISTTNGELGDTTDTVAGVLEGEDATISINHRYLLDCLQSRYSDSVILSFFGQGKPMVVHGVTDKSFTYLVMPMNN